MSILQTCSLLIFLTDEEIDEVGHRGAGGHSPARGHATAQSQPVDPGPFLQLLLYLLDAHEVWEEMLLKLF